MNDLPTQALPTIPTSQDPQNIQGGAGTLHKEAESVSPAVESSGIKEVGHETTLPPEVSAAGVTLRPTSVTLPPNVAQMGVAPIGNTTQPVQQTPTVALPLTDDQIIAGLHKSISSSVRWLATWCMRRLKQLHLALRNVGGKTIRVNSK